MSLAVQKFGGTSVRDAAHIRAVAERIAETVRAGTQVVVAVSAIGNETDELLHMAPQVSSVRTGRELDMLITAGERKAAALLCLALQDLGIPADSFTGSQAGILTDARHTSAQIVEVHPDRIRTTLEAGRIPVVGGAQGISTEGDVTFLGRGGTDTTAVALAWALGADTCEVYTDVAGVFSSDPTLVPDARLLSHIGFDEMLAMCAAGCPKPAKQAVELARERGVPLHVRSAFDPAPGTRIDGSAAVDRAGVIAVVIDPEVAEPSPAENPDSECARVSIVGPGVESQPASAERMSGALARTGISASEFSAGPARLSSVIRTADVEGAVVTLHREFRLGGALPQSKPRSEHVGEARRAARQESAGGD